MSSNAISEKTISYVQLNEYPKERYNVLIPVTSMQVLSNMQRIIVNEVKLDTNVDQNGSSKDVYKERSSGKYAITKVGAMKLAAAANISVVSSESVKPDVCIKCIEMAKAVGKAPLCGTCPHANDVKFRVTVRVPEPSGGFRLITKDKEIDCSIEKESMKPDQFKRFLPHRASIAESKALMRCIRDALSLAAGYTLEELKKPFIVAHIVPNFDAPEIRERVANSYLQSMGLLFEQPAEKPQLTNGPSNLIEAPQEVTESITEDEPFSEGDYADNDDITPEDLEFMQGTYCEQCGAEIVEVTGSNGKTWSPEAIESYSKNRFGRCLCPTCQRQQTSQKG